MLTLYRKGYHTPEEIETELVKPSLQDDIEKTRKALDIAYAGFDYATDPDIIDAYIYQINSLLSRYKHLHEHSSSGLSIGQTVL